LPPTIRIAVTGGIACGKTLACTYLAERGVAVCDADEVAHRLMRPGTPLCRAVLRRFGGGIRSRDGGIDRAALGRLVFASAAAREALNALVHPGVAEEIAAWLEGRAEEVAAVQIPLLYEAGMQEGWDAVVCVCASPEVQEQRLLARGLRPDEIRQRREAQWPVAEKALRADFAVWNDGEAWLLKAQVDCVLERIRGGWHGAEAE
jgi:dephospho-CoA kinase